MKLVKLVFGAIILVMGCIFAGGFLLPSSATVERSILIDGDAKTVFKYINSVEMAQLWSPWAKMDPNMSVTYFGPKSGVGAGVSWESQVERVGKGRQTITESVMNKRVESLVEFGDRSNGLAYLELSDTGGQVQVNWGFTMDYGNNPVMRYIGLAMDGILGKVYEKGLIDLKALVEGLPAMVGEVVHYQVGDTHLTGYLAYPRTAKNAPGILVVHEWWGHNDYARKRADMLAELGYVAFALDMYGDGKVTGHPKEANAFMMEVVNNAGAAQARFMAAYDIVKEHPATNPQKMAAIGYCYGGAVVLSMARAGVELKGVASFHGSLQGLSPIREGGVDTPFLIFNGADDPFVPAEQKVKFKAEMDAANIQYQFIDYPGAVHAFTNIGATAKGEEYGLPLRYDAGADVDSWKKMQAFFTQIF